MSAKAWLIRMAVGAVVLLSGTVQAQILDFDGVCPTPPCGAGSIYAASGVSVGPPSLPVVAAGTGGLTGTNGGKYLSINTFPYQATFTLARTATFVSLDVSRSNLTTAGQTFTLQALDNGAPVGPPQTVVLGAVNAWSNVSISLPAGFNGFFLDSGAGGVVKTFGADNIHIGGNCAGFGDVLPSDVFCNATEWLVNRGVTLGCGPGQYCPANNVTRAQMALFMNRLGNALTPSIYNPYQGQIQQVGWGVPNNSVVYCQQAIPPASYPRQLTHNAVMGIVTLANTATVRLTRMYSLDGGASWGPYGHDTFTLQDVSNVAWTSLHAVGVLAIPAGSSVTVGLFVTRYFGAATGIASAECEAVISVINSTSAVAPFDPTPRRPGN